ncbi:hypothetical protein EDI_081060 [Entamoeba dispar SAW760]|uniref:Uncharacterized protein n=1 Tax=Entamoeba dispar (strain ATCC PRA-260 / SAW760) TaxID=370354 RepID=B0EGU5_ENTDS|nr:uncharacterized protein EDI_081060 [Entamoeba dispar SAW760]EDR26249.1 hypothetical protein EDI_081060 [Entamoeba dispar SAW760]|eukprot:EDR26249.1 hypothetical protein EDI_081060 [Entamoeba dispar SAW760]
MFFDLYGVPRLNLHKKRYGSYGSIRGWYGNYKFVNKKPYTYQRVYDRSPSDKRNEFDKRYNRDYDKRHEETKPRRPDSNRPQRPTNKRPTQDRRPSQKDKPGNRPENKRPVQDRKPTNPNRQPVDQKKPRQPTRPEQRRPTNPNNNPTQKPSKIDDKYDPDLGKIVDKEIKKIEDRTDSLFDKGGSSKEKDSWWKDVKDTIGDRVKDISERFPKDLKNVIKNNPAAKLDASLIRTMFDKGIKVGGSLLGTALTAAAGEGGKDLYKGVKDRLNRDNVPTRKNTTQDNIKYMRDKCIKGKDVKNEDLDAIKQMLLDDPSLVKDYVHVIFTEQELGKLYEDDRDYGSIPLPTVIGDELHFVPARVLQKDGERYYAPEHYVAESEGIVIDPKYQNQLLKNGNEFELFPDSLGDLLPDDLQEYNARRLTFIYEQLPDELRRHIRADLSIDHAAAYRYAKLLQLQLPRELSTGSNDDYYHKINYGMRTHQRIGGGRRWFEASDFEKKSNLIEYMRNHYMWNRDGGDRLVYPDDPNRSGFNYLKGLGTSENEDEWGSVLLKVSPTDPDTFKVYTRPDGRKVFVENKPNENHVYNLN